MGWLVRRDGAAALELALLLPFLTLMLIGVFDFGTLMYQMMQVNEAAYAGVAAAVAVAEAPTPGTCTTALITTAEQKATSLGSAITTSGTAKGLTGPSCSLTAYVSGSGASATLTTSSCSGCVQGTYAVAYASLSITPLIPWSQFGFPSTLSSIAVSRIS